MAILDQQSVRDKHYLFGFPISHSHSPGFQNAVFDSLGLPNRYILRETQTVDDPGMIELLRSPDHAGSAVTMPLKVSAMALMDKVTEEAKAIGSINTVYLEEEAGEMKLVGTNTDWLGIRNALGRALEARPAKATGSAFIIGGGGTTRAGVYALDSLGFSPIYLINRDPAETKAVIDYFTDKNLVALNYASEWTDEMAKSLCTGLGAIPDIPPSTPAEKEVYAIAEKIFDSCARIHGRGNYCNMLEMAYKPRRTTMLKLAESYGWNVVEGVEAMIEQDRLWLLKSAASPYGAGTRSELPSSAEAAGRAYVAAL